MGAVAAIAPASFSIEQFRTEGWVRIGGAFTAAEAAAMRDAVWRSLEAVGIRRDHPGTWRTERPDHLQHLKSDPVFQAVGSRQTLAAIDHVLAGQPWRHPSDWGAFFIVFPINRPWNVPDNGWHVDADYAGPLDPPRGVKVHAMFGDVGPRGGGMHIISGSHDGISLQVLENTAAAGDVILMHPLMLHAPPTAHLGSAPRFLLNKDIYL